MSGRGYDVVRRCYIEQHSIVPRVSFPQLPRDLSPLFLLGIASATMKFSTIVAAAALAAPAFAAGDKDKSKGKKLVTPKELVKDVKLKDLLAGSRKLQEIADANGGNRAFGGGGHNATVDWLYKTLKATGYYNVEKQAFVELFTAATIGFEANGEEYPAAYMVRVSAACVHHITNG